MAITMDKDRTLREYREGSARDGRFYDSTGNSWYPESDKEARQLNRLLKKHFKSYSVDKDGSIKGHETEDGGPHKTSGKRGMLGINGEIPPNTIHQKPSLWE